MIGLDVIKDCYVTTPSKIVMLVVDGLGGLPHPETRLSELETAATPNLDLLARESACGLTVPILPGVAPGSGPGHLALFGYDPLKYLIGRGVLEALGIEVDLKEGDVSARGNFCIVDGEDLLVDRRAGRIPSEISIPLCEDLNEIEVEGVQLSVYPVEGYRFVLHLRGDGLSDMVSETDPQVTGAGSRGGGSNRARRGEDRRDREGVRSPSEGDPQERGAGQYGAPEGVLDDPPISHPWAPPTV